MTLRKKILFYALLTLFTLAAVEGMARLAYYLAFAEGYSPSRSLAASAADLAAADTVLGEPAGLARRAPEHPRRRAFRISHPHYGFTVLFSDSPLNVMPPPQTGPDTVTIGLLGGSVAWEIVPYFQDALTRYFADQGLDKEPVVIQLASGAVKQPQQFHIAGFMLNMGGDFDFLVNLDGYNELDGSYVNFSNAVFPSFPVHWENLVFVTREEIALAGQIRSVRDQLTQLQQAGPASPFRYTALYGILHRYQTRQAETRILQLNYELSNLGQARSLEQQGPYVPFRNVSQVHQEAVRVWYRSSILLDAIANRAGADYYHFLQPNQYIPDSKPLSDRERRDFLTPDEAATTNFAETYPLFVQFGQELQEWGVNYFDLTQIFNDRTDTLYRDPCCHYNKRGYELVAAAMVERLAPALRRRAAAPSPATDGTLTVAAPLPLGPAPEQEPALSPAEIPFAAATEPDYQVSLRPGNFLLYVKDNCGTEHTTASFLLHITPVDPSHLSRERRHHRFESLDFSFAEVGVRSGYWGGRQCIIEYPLPDYPIAHIRTGQYNPAGEIWATELTFPQ